MIFDIDIFDFDGEVGPSIFKNLGLEEEISYDEICELAKLEEWEIEFLKLTFMDCLTQEESGKHFNHKQPWVHKRLKKILIKLKGVLNENSN